ncbi:MAG: pyridoxal phosphate-dependent aminotransferase family protein [Oscillospiraceae bacterium]|nr:pyridoxal phosphate-dependent aminotransferase family protein [Oscillospiraceae bacterium]
MDIFTKCEKFTAADELRQQDLFPYFRELQSRQDTEVIMEGQRRIMLGSNNYLGLTTVPEIVNAAKAALDEYGTGCSGSRLLNGTLILHQQFEKEMAAFLGKDDVVTFSTGFQSNLGIISAIVGRGDYVICDKENHASIYDGCKLSYGKMLRYNHADMDGLEAQLKKVPESAGALIVTDGVFSMGGDIAKLPEIVALAKRYGARVMVDDAHALGVIGRGGRGTASYFGLEDEVDIYMGTFSKSLASLGGYMAASAKVADYVRCNSRPYIFSASVPPACIAVATASLRYLIAHPERVDRLQAIAQYMREQLLARGVSIRVAKTPIIPIYTYDMLRTLQVQKELYERGVYVNASLPPATAPNECLLRCSLMATHTEAQVDEAVSIIADVLSRHRLEPKEA